MERQNLNASRVVLEMQKSQSIKFVYFVAANNNFTFTEKQKIIRKTATGRLRRDRQVFESSSLLKLNLIKSTIVIISDNTGRHDFYFWAKMVASKTICLR